MAQHDASYLAAARNGRLRTDRIDPARNARFLDTFEAKGDAN
jgi:hypothetical protein